MVLLQLLVQLLLALTTLFGSGSAAGTGTVDNSQLFMLLLNLLGSGGGCSSCG